MSPSLPHPDDPSFVFDPLTPDFDRNPYPVLAHLREHAPVYWWAPARGWFVTRHEDVIRILSDEENFSPDDAHWEHFTPPPEEAADHPVVRMRGSSILSMEGAQHARTRRLAFEALSRRAVRTIEPLMSALMDEILEPIRSRGTCDFVAEIASPYPVGVISRLLGIPANSDREKHFKQLADAVIVAFNPMTDEPTVMRAIHLMTGYLAEVRAWMDEKRRDPAEDLMSHLVQVESEGDRFQPDEILSLVSGLLVAGSETTANSISFGILELLRHPDQLKLFKEDRGCRANAAYEIVRFEMPGRFLRRYAKKSVTIRGVEIQAGKAVYPSVASAQRDPSFLPDADRFDITRSPRDLSAFGVGRHFCIGAQLARLELEVGLSRIFDTLPNIELDCGFDEVPFRSNPAIRGPAALPIRFDPTS